MDALEFVTAETSMLSRFLKYYEEARRAEQHKYPQDQSAMLWEQWFLDWKQQGCPDA